MQSEFGKVEGNVHVTEEMDLFRMCTANVTVAEGGVLRLFGMFTGNVEVQPGGTFFARGHVHRQRGQCRGIGENHRHGYWQPP